MPWQIVHRCCLFESFFFFARKYPTFSPWEDRPDRARRQEAAGVGRRCAELRNGVCMMNASHLFKDVSQDSAEWRKDAAPGWLMRPSHPPSPGFGLLFLDLPQTSARSAEREAAGSDPSLREQIGGKERERLSQWSCVHSFMSFVSPEEISAKLTEPNA